MTPIVWLWLRESSASWRQLPRPTDNPHVHAAGCDPDRILLFGSGLAVGYGVASHDLALGGQLARAISDTTGRGVSLDVLARSHVPLRQATRFLRQADLNRYDAMVIFIGGIEVLTQLGRAVWRKQLQDLLAYIENNSRSCLQVFVVEMWLPEPSLPTGLARMAARSMRSINAESQLVIDQHPRVTFVPFRPPVDTLLDLVARDTYQEWAGYVAPVVSRVLDERGASRRPEHAVDETARLRALQALDVGSIPAAQFDEIVTTARDLFGASGAAFSFVEGEERNTVAARGLSIGRVPRKNALSSMVIEQAGLFEIEDTARDWRAAMTRSAPVEEFRFYAAHPIESPDGHRIGVLCVVDTMPRKFSDSDAALLRQLALSIQSVIWAHAGSKPGGGLTAATRRPARRLAR